MPAPDNNKPIKAPCRPKGEDPQLKIDTLTAEELMDLFINAEIANAHGDTDDAGNPS